MDKDTYLTINNLILENTGGTTKTTQIDHLVVSRYGIFVIETKNYKGIIKGSENYYQWTCNIYDKKYSFMNPINQNYAHIKAVENILKDDYKNMRYFSIIAFSPEAEVNVKSKRSNICKISEVSDIIQSLSTDEILSEDDIIYIRDKIKNSKIRISNRAHARNVKKSIKYQSKMTSKK